MPIFIPNNQYLTKVKLYLKKDLLYEQYKFNEDWFCEICLAHLIIIYLFGANVVNDLIKTTIIYRFILNNFIFGLKIEISFPILVLSIGGCRVFLQ